ncbi:sensor histidine kinase [Candidatus Enterococcus mansonii]|uniref:histidine kinase n=1 Tax=Candidatus Enterococcus mansonii TaxID=1834181 RepID=A0A242CJS9_9ENTE|nr:HAMP domain-containing sensor histidine kinase [Enterococcus sp. 4G2_DIV0659]OTO10042.1 hypothetical protein A5880_000725 [Enterococcus sp. 4G2_DIV0659]
MQVTLFLSFILLFGLISCLLFLKNRALNQQLNQITNELSNQVAQDKKKKIQLFSDELAIQKLLVQINQLLDNHQALAISQLRQSNGSKKMLSNISHDLKTPLTVILGYSEMLLFDEELTTKTLVKERIERIKKQAENVLHTINVFFDLAKLESDEFLLKQEKIDLTELCRNEILTYFEALENDRTEVVVDISETPMYIVGDTEAMKRILSNLLSNAIRYGNEGHYLKLSVWADKQKAFIEVTDKGRGILEENHEKIFERLFTLNDSRNKNYQGSGLGLTITKQLVEAMSGTIKLYSKPYHKTIFTVSFPIE